MFLDIEEYKNRTKEVTKLLSYSKKIKKGETYLGFMAVVILLQLTACSGLMNHGVQEDMMNQSNAKLDQAQQTVALALEYHDQGGYEKSAELFLNAADLFEEIGARDEQRRAIIAAAKVQLKCSLRQKFLLTMARFRGLIGQFEMPSEEERFLIDLADHMKEKHLTYPVKESWRIIFES